MVSFCLQKLIESEACCGRTLLDQKEVRWDQAECAAAGSMRIAVRVLSEAWEAREPLYHGQTWSSDEKTFEQVHGALAA